jgi:uncharacterized protein DUF4136
MSRLVLVSAALIALLACASNDEIPVSSSYDPLYRFPAQAAFYWDDEASSLPDDPDIDRASTDALFKQVAGEAFAARGWRAGQIDAPYRLSYQYVVNRRTGPDETFAMGSVSLNLVERATRRRVWTGFGRAEIYQGLTVEERRTRLREALDRMLVFFPPTQRPKD